MDAMRLMARLDAAKEKFQSEVERILADAHQSHGAAAGAIRQRIARALDDGMGKTKGKTAKKAPSLGTIVRRLLAQTTAPMTKAAIWSKVKGARWSTKSANPRSVVGAELTRLIKLGTVKKVGRGPAATYLEVPK